MILSALSHIQMVSLLSSHFILHSTWLQLSQIFSTGHMLSAYFLCNVPSMILYSLSPICPVSYRSSYSVSPNYSCFHYFFLFKNVFFTVPRSVARCNIIIVHVRYFWVLYDLRLPYINVRYSYGNHERVRLLFTNNNVSGSFWLRWSFVPCSPLDVLTIAPQTLSIRNGSLKPIAPVMRVTSREHCNRNIALKKKITSRHVRASTVQCGAMMRGSKRWYIHFVHFHAMNWTTWAPLSWNCTFSFVDCTLKSTVFLQPWDGNFIEVIGIYRKIVRRESKHTRIYLIWICKAVASTLLY